MVTNITMWSLLWHLTTMAVRPRMTNIKMGFRSRITVLISVVTFCGRVWPINVCGYSLWASSFPCLFSSEEDSRGEDTDTNVTVVAEVIADKITGAI